MDFAIPQRHFHTWFNLYSLPRWLHSTRFFQHRLNSLNLDSCWLTFGYCFMLGRCVVDSVSCKQCFVALSSTKSEYMAFSCACTKAIWLHWLLDSLYCSQSTANIIFSNNQSAAQSTKNPKFHEWSKHIDIQVHFICGQMQANIVKLIFCATFDMTTSILTKSLSKDKHLHCVCLMGLRTI